MKRTTLAVSTLVLAAVLAAPAVGQVNEQVARGATVTREFCANHTAMRDALFVRYVAGGSGKAGIASRFVRRPATDREAIGRLATVHDRLMLGLRGEKRARWIPVSIGKPGQLLVLRPVPAPSTELVRASLTNLGELCSMHLALHQEFAAGKPADIRTLRGHIETATPDCPHGA